MTKPGYCDGCPDASKEHGCAWSASPNAANTDNAWNVNFNNGNDNWNNKNNNNSVRLVRGECNPCGAASSQGHEPPPETPTADIDLAALEHAWRSARRKKHPSHNRLAFEARWMERLIELRKRLAQGRWRPSPAACFITLRPKAREIHAPDFSDRVVHHWLVPRLERLYESVFIHDCHANRKGHGTHAAVDRLQGMMRQVVDGECGWSRCRAKEFAPTGRSPDGAQRNPGMSVSDLTFSPDCHPGYKTLCPPLPKGSTSSSPPLEKGGRGDWNRSHAPAWKRPGLPLQRRSRHDAGASREAFPRWSMGAIDACFTPSPLTGEGWGEGGEVCNACAVFEAVAPSPQPSPARGEGAKTPPVGAGFRQLRDNSFAHRFDLHAPEPCADESVPTEARLEKPTPSATCGYALQLDVRNFFNRIHRPTLYALLKVRLAKAERKGRIDAQERHTMQTLCHALLARHPAAGVRYRDDEAARAAVPEHKRLENAPPGCGLPIGNLTSQFFANVYLNELDQFVKHELKCRHYVRYVDDFVLLHRSAAQLDAWRHAIERFLADKLKLGLKDDIRLKPIAAGVDFLGYVIYPHGRRIRRRIHAHADERVSLALRALPRHRDGRLALPREAVQRLCSVLASYQGHAAHAGRHQALAFAQRLYARHDLLACVFHAPQWQGGRLLWQSRLEPTARDTSVGRNSEAYSAACGVDGEAYPAQYAALLRPTTFTFLAQAQSLLAQNPALEVLIMQRGCMAWVYQRPAGGAGVPEREAFRLHWSQLASFTARLRTRKQAYGVAEEVRLTRDGRRARAITVLYSVACFATSAVRGEGDIDSARFIHESVRSEPVEEPCFDRLSMNGVQALFSLKSCRINKTMSVGANLFAHRFDTHGSDICANEFAPSGRSPDGAGWRQLRVQRNPGMRVSELTFSPDCHPGYKTLMLQRGNDQTPSLAALGFSSLPLDGGGLGRGW